jgi:3-dehydroquinate synthase
MKLNVNLPQTPYDIVIEKGVLAKAGDWVKSLWQPQKIALITDNHVGSLYAEKVKLSIENAGFEVIVFDFLEGEASKNLQTVNKAYEFLVKNGMTRSDGIVALGGGVVGDLAGFVASTYMRGIHFLQIPTSLTAQVDSSNLLQGHVENVKFDSLHGHALQHQFQYNVHEVLIKFS